MDNEELNRRIGQGYTKDQVKRTKELMSALFPASRLPAQALHLTPWGVKTDTGLLNVILAITYGKEKE